MITNSRGTKVEKTLTLAPERYTAGFCMVAKVIMVYLKPLYSRLDRLADRQSSQLSTEAQQEHIKILFFKMLYIFIKKVQD